MAIVGGLDIHRRQVTYDWIDTNTGETRRGQLSPATRLELRVWLEQFHGHQADFALEATTGWRFVAEELEHAGFRAHLAEPADTRALRGPKRRAKTDRTDAHHLRELLRAGTLPESWMPPAHIADARTQVRLRRALVGERTGWHQRIHAILFHHGLPERSQLLTADGWAWLARAELPAVARGAVELALRMIDHLEAELDTLDGRAGRHRPWPARLPSAPAALWDRLADRGERLGRVRRRAPLRQQPPGGPLLWPGHHHQRVRRQTRPGTSGPPGLPGAALGAARGGHVRRRPTSPDHPYYLQVKQRLGSKRAALSVARKLAREAYHTLRELGDQALVPAELPTAA
jgi:transposase